ncbi:Transient Receptor Potential Cation Channel Subfamily M Member 6 [Manis pentadactyla]|nr:Transient Receptor Potential Cation Channel Subfamily M Member 6 [Manis pentadactyla]
MKFGMANKSSWRTVQYGVVYEMYWGRRVEKMTGEIMSRSNKISSGPRSPPGQDREIHRTSELCPLHCVTLGLRL